MRHFTKLAAAVSLCALSSTAAQAANIIYSVSFWAGAAGSLTGTLTTDGTIGNITGSNFVAWNLLLTGRDAFGHTVTETLTDADSTLFSGSFLDSNGVIQGSVTGLTATPTALTFDFSGTTPSFILFQRVFGSAASFACIARTSNTNLCGGTGVHVDPKNTDADGTNAGQGPSNAILPPPTGVRIFAAVVPEPSTWLSMIAGFGMVGFGMRRRAKVATTARIAFA
jgi:hypothetical protein